MTDDEDFEAGRQFGLRPEGSAVDCPFLPGDDQDRRDRWLNGFASVREGVAVIEVDLPPQDQQDRHAG